MARACGDATTILDLSKAVLRLGRDTILSDVDLEIPRGARAIVVGPNGSGKTTLLSLIAGQKELESGNLRTEASSIGWLRQEAVSGSVLTVFEEAMSQMPGLAARENVDACLTVLSSATDMADIDAAQKKYDAAAEVYEAADGHSIEHRASQVLQGLSFGESDFQKPCSELSGGWQMRVALARALLQEPDLLLLDEPTNHMDASAKKWLATYLDAGMPHSTTLMLVTHDRSLLEEIKCTHVVEIAQKRILRYECKGIKEWENKRKDQTLQIHKEIVKLTQAANEDKAFIAKWGAKASHASLAQSRGKKLVVTEKRLAELAAALRGLPTTDLLKKDAKEREEPVEGTLALATPGKMNLRLPGAPLAQVAHGEPTLLQLLDAGIGHTGAAPIIDDMQLYLKAGTRVALLGPNGCGKTTLLRSLAGILPLHHGERKLAQGAGMHARVAYFSQDLAQDLPCDKTPIEYVLSGDAPSTLDETGARRALGALGLRGENHKLPIGILSGGEKARVALAVFTTRPADVLLLDEPTNHLDGAAVGALAQGLKAHHKGAVVVASHDKAFIEALSVTKALTVVPSNSPGRAAQVQETQGLPEQLTAKKISEAAVASAQESVEQMAKPVPAAAPPKSRKQANQQLQRARFVEKQKAKLMEKIESMEEALEEAQTAMSANYSDETLAKYEAAQKEVDELYEQWEVLEES